MRTLKFSHDYAKLPIEWEGLKAKLMGIDCVSLENLPKDFIEYDTVTVGIGSIGHYPLPKKGRYMLLWFFITEPAKRGLFCTIRRYTDRKFSYYLGNLYEEFELTRCED